MTTKPLRAVVIGAGIGGLSAALALRKVGMDVSVYESKPDVRLSGAGLLVGANAMQALDRLGVAAEVMASSRVLTALDIVTSARQALSRTVSAVAPPGNGGSPDNRHPRGYPDNVTIHRSDLLAILADALGPDDIHTGKACISVDIAADHVRAEFADGSVDVADVLIAADGIHSVVRRQLMPGAQPRYAGYTCWRAVIDDDPTLRFDREIATETWGLGARFGLVPLANNRLYWFACLNARENDQAHAQATAATLRRQFAPFHSPIPDILERTGTQPLIWRDIAYLPPLRRFVVGRVALLGDAAHATTPNLGQGAAQAMEDAVVLAAAFKETDDVAAALRRYEQARVPRTTRVTKASNQVGKVGQWQHPWLVGLRSWLMPRLPASATQKQFDYLHGVTLPDLN